MKRYLVLLIALISACKSVNDAPAPYVDRWEEFGARVVECKHTDHELIITDDPKGMLCKCNSNRHNTKK